MLFVKKFCQGLCNFLHKDPKPQKPPAVLLPYKRINYAIIYITSITIPLK
jgi:hypothetical protein